MTQLYVVLSALNLSGRISAGKRRNSLIACEWRRGERAKCVLERGSLSALKWVVEWRKRVKCWISTVVPSKKLTFQRWWIIHADWFKSKIHQATGPTALIQEWNCLYSVKRSAKTDAPGLVTFVPALAYLPRLSQLACSIHATWSINFSRSLYISSLPTILNLWLWQLWCNVLMLCLLSDTYGVVQKCH